MAEGLFGGLLGDEEEIPELESETLGGADAFAAAVAARLSANDPGVARKTEEFLAEQTRLLAVQRALLEDEHALRLSRLRGQRLGIYIRVGFQIFVALAATVVGVVFAVLLHDAVTSRSVIVEAFAAPPALSGHGMNGTVVAGAFLDELTRLQNATQTSAAAKRDLSSAWSHEVTVSMPDAGISLGELSHLLRARFGHDLHIEGDLVETNAGGLALTVRGDGVRAREFTGSTDELHKLIVTAAEYVYSESQPVLWAIYLEGAARFPEELAFIKATYSSASPADRPYLLNSWGNINGLLGGSQQESLRLYQTAIKLKPDYWVPQSNIQGVLVGLGQEEAAWRAGEDLRRAAGGRPGAAGESYYGASDALTWNLQVKRDAELADADASGGVGTSDYSVGATLAQDDVYLHDPAAAELTLQTTKPDDRDPTIEAGLRFARGLLAMENGDVAKAVAEMESFGDMRSNVIVRNGYSNAPCWIARAEEQAGRPEKADDMLKDSGTFVDCYRFRGDILDHRGDWTAAQKAYADAVALAPDLPAGYYSWGVALAKHGDFAAATDKLEQANKRGPHWADPLKAWGDVLAKQGRRKEALAKYDEALEYAPTWTALHAARDALEKQGAG
jgi:tetratricopeptide (TPR) repeat protein